MNQGTTTPATATSGVSDNEDSDSDGINDIVDSCPYDSANDFDIDNLCASVDSCPNDATNGNGGSTGCRELQFSDELLYSLAGLLKSSDVADVLGSFVNQSSAMWQMSAATFNVTTATWSMTVTGIVPANTNLNATDVVSMLTTSLAKTLGLPVSSVRVSVVVRASTQMLRGRRLSSGTYEVVIQVEVIQPTNETLATTWAPVISTAPPCSTGADVDSDFICDAADSCPFDKVNDIDGDGLCALTECVDSNASSIHGDCESYGFDGANAGFCEADNMCSLCPCSCAHECHVEWDKCPFDVENDADSDGLCADVDSCPSHEWNDPDSDSICNENSCMLDPFHDADSDMICGPVDSCPFDADNDFDSDTVCSLSVCVTEPSVCQTYDSSVIGANGVIGRANAGRCVADGKCSECPCTCAFECGFDDLCPFDAFNDIDSDGLCAENDSCPWDSQNDADSDTVCARDSCFGGDTDSDGVCDFEDSCPFDAVNDLDGDQLCSEIDSCPFSAMNDANGDNLCDLDMSIVATTPATTELDDWVIVLIVGIFVIVVVVIAILVWCLVCRPKAVASAKVQPLHTSKIPPPGSLHTSGHLIVKSEGHLVPHASSSTHSAEAPTPHATGFTAGEDESGIDSNAMQHKSMAHTADGGDAPAEELEAFPDVASSTIDSNTNVPSVNVKKDGNDTSDVDKSSGRDDGDELAVLASVVNASPTHYKRRDDTSVPQTHGMRAPENSSSSVALSEFTLSQIVDGTQSSVSPLDNFRAEALDPDNGGFAELEVQTRSSDTKRRHRKRRKSPKRSRTKKSKRSSTRRSKTRRSSSRRRRRSSKAPSK